MKNQIFPLYETDVNQPFPPDEELATMFKVGQTDRALRLLFQKNKTSRSSFECCLMRLGASLPDAQDVCQDAMLCFLQNMQAGKFQVRREGCLMPYLFAIARHLWLKECRKRKSAFHIAIDHSPQLADVPTEMEASPLQPMLENCLQKLDQRSHRLLWGYHVENCGYEKLANELGLASWRVACQQAYRKRGELRREIMKQLSAA